MAEFPNAVKTWADLIDWPDPMASRASASDINSAYAEITAIESILLSDTDTLNSSSDAHGLLPKLDGSSDNFLNGLGQWTVPLAKASSSDAEAGTDDTKYLTSKALKDAGFVAVDLIGGVPHKQIYAAAGLVKPTLTSGCAPASQIEMGTNKNVYDYLAFDPSATEYAFFNVAVPQDYTGGTMYFKVLWTHPATTTNFGVAWGLQGVAISNDDTLDVAQGTGVLSVDTGGTTSDFYLSDLSGKVTIAGSPAVGDLINFRVYRKHDDAGDTMAVDAYFLSIMVWYPVA